MSEDWRPIHGVPDYEVSSLGRVASWKPMRNFARPPLERRILRPSFDKNGYRRVSLQLGRSKRYMRVCRLVAMAWCGSPPDGYVVRHLDGSKTNDTPNNLVWGTPAENSADTLTHGTRVVGAKVNTCKLREQDVLEIRASKLGHSELARKFGVTPCAIWHIRAGRTWKYV